MYDVVEAVLLEAYDLRARATGSRLGTALGSRAGSASAATRTAAGSTTAGSVLGDSARRLSGVVAALPVATVTPDAIRHAYCVDLLTDRWTAGRSDPLDAVQLAEAVLAAQRAQEIVRLARVTDPAGYLMGAMLRNSSRLGRDGVPHTTHRLARAAHRSILRAGGPSTVDHHLALARAYRLTGKPGLATRYASVAGSLATRTLAASRPEPGLSARFAAVFTAGGWRDAARELADTASTVLDRIDDAVDRIEASYTGESVMIDLETRTRMQIGTAWTTIGWALRDAGDRDGARSAARAAVAAGFTSGNEVLAALVDPQDGSLTDRLGRRIELLARVARRDRTFYRGRWRGSAWIAGATVVEQARKTRRLLDGSTS